MSNKFGLPESLLDAVKQVRIQENEYQEKVKALLKKRGFTSIGQMSPEEKKDFFNTLDSMHKAKDEQSFMRNPMSAAKKILQNSNDVKEEVELKEGYEKVVLNFLDKKGFDSPHFKNGDLYVSKSEFAGVKKALKNPTGFNASDLKVIAEEVELEEGKSSTGYELYHKDFSSAMAHAYDFAKKKYNIEVDPQEIDRNVAMGPRKPSSGKANAYRLLDKTGKKAIQVQVANLDNKRYELNMYKEDIDEACWDTHRQDGMKKKGDKMVPNCVPKEESSPPFTPDKPKKNPGVVPGKHGAGPSIAKHLAKMAMKKQMDKDKKKPMKEEEELDEAIPKSTGHALIHSSSKKIIAKGSKAEMMKKMKELNAKEKGSHYLGATSGKVGDTFGFGPSPADKLSIRKEEELDESMSSAQVTKLRQEYDKIKTIDPSSDNYKKLTAMLDKLDLKTLQQLAGAKIKFVSSLAQNRVVRKMNEEKSSEDVEESVNPQKSMKKAGLSVERAKEVMRHRKEIGSIRKKRESLREKEEVTKDKDQVTTKQKTHKKGETLSGKKEPITINPEVDEKK